MGRKHSSILRGVILGAAALSVSVFAWAYVVKKGDTLSQIAATHLGRPIYGQSGNLKKLLAQNDKIQNPNLIRIGQEINLPGEAVASHKHKKHGSRQTASEEAPKLQSPVETPAPEFKSYGLISFTPEFLATKISATDRATNATASLISKSNFGGTLAYSQVWSKTFQTDFFFGMNKLSVKEPSTGGTLSNADQTLYSFGAIADFGLTPKFTLKTGLGVFERVYLKAISASTVTLDPFYVPSIIVLGAYDFYTQNPFTLGGQIGANFDLPQSQDAYNTKFNTSYLGAVYVKHDLSHSLQTEVGLKANYSTQDTSITQQSETDFGFYLKLMFPFGENKK